MNYTIYDIARVANVSKSTVSRALNNQSNVSEEARKRVMSAIEQLNYQPSKLARGLSSGFDAIMVISRSTKTTMNNPYFVDVLQNIAERAEEENFDVILQTSKNSTDELEKCITKIQGKMIKGIIMLSSPANEELFKQLDLFNIPIIVIGKVEGNYHNIYSVDTDNYQDSYQLTKYLIDQGHSDIACLHSPLEYHVSIDRLNGYKDCIKDHQLATDPNWIIETGFTIETANIAAQQLLLMENRPTAVFATDDLKILSIYKAAAELNLSIPEQLSIVGYSNNNHVQFLTPSLTSIEIPVRRLGKIAADILFSNIRGRAEQQKRTIVETSHHIGHSVRSIL